MFVLRAFAAAVLCGLAVSYAKKTPDVAPASAPATEFSAERALTHIKRVAERPHPSGSDAHAAVLAYVVAEIRKLGLTPEIQTATGVGTRYAVAGHVKNILVRVPGTQPGGLAVLLVAHYDGVGAGPAAGDDAAGTGALLETLRALRAGPPLMHDVILLFTDSEEAGLLGAAAFAREHPWAKDAGVILNFEARGVGGPSFMFETGRGNLDVARVMRDHAEARGTSLSTAVYRRLPNDTDLSELLVLDRPAMNFAFIGGVGRYHTSEDDVAHLELGSVQHHGSQALALARAFANGPLPRPATADAVFFFIPGLGTFVYPESWALYIAIAALVILVVVLVRGRTIEPQRWVGSVAVGFGAALVTTVVGALAGYGLGAGFVRLHAEMGTGQPRLSDVYAAATVFAVVALTLLLYRLSLWKWKAAGVEAGALVWWSIVSIAVALYVPGASFLFVWPLAAAIVAAHASSRGAKAAVALHWVTAIVVVAMVVPTAYAMVVVALGLDAVGGAILGLLVAMGVTLARPVIVVPSDGWWTAAVPAAAAAWAAVIGATTVRTNAEHPEGGSLVFAIDADSGRAFASGYSSGPVAAKWVSATIGGARAPASDLPLWVRRLAGGRPVMIAEPYASPLTAPRVTVLKDSSGIGERTVQVRIQPGGTGTLSMGLDLDTTRVLAATVDGRSIDRERYRRRPTRWALEFIAPPDSGFTLSLTMPADARPILGVTARRAGLVAWPLTLVPRPPGVIPIQSGDMSVVHTRARLEIPPRRRR
jgi:hypothetical protein